MRIIKSKREGREEREREIFEARIQVFDHILLLSMRRKGVELQ